MLRAPRFRPALQGVRAPECLPDEILDSRLGRENGPVLQALLHDLQTLPPRALWMALVPGESEEWGHHRAPPIAAEAKGVRISAAFEDRLARAYNLLERDVVRYLLISGAAVDPTRPDYVEAHRGREQLVARYAQRFASRGDLASRVLVDPTAFHSTTNVRNADQLASALGLDALLIATTMPPSPWLWPRGIPFLHQINQGWYYLHHRVSSFDWCCRRTLGYALGAFDWFEAKGITAIAHHGLAHDALRRDLVRHGEVPQTPPPSIARSTPHEGSILAQLKDILLQPGTRPKVLGECETLLDEEVASKSGLSGLAVKGAFAMVKAVKPGVIRESIDGLLDDFVARLEPFWGQYESSGSGTSFPDYLAARGGEASDALLGITDERAHRAKNATLKKAYEKLRPQGKKHVQEAMPRLGRLIARHAK